MGTGNNCIQINMSCDHNPTGWVGVGVLLESVVLTVNFQCLMSVHVQKNSVACLGRQVCKGGDTQW